MAQLARRRKSWSRLACLLMAGTTAAMIGGLQGCSDDPEPPATPPSATYNGPDFLQGTVGSLSSLRGYEPLYVSGYGLVVDLNGTGSTSTPTYIRSWMVTQMRKAGFGSGRYGTETMTPERILASGTASVVVLEGLIPPGARKGTRFDVLVTALPGTQTTSLRNGNLYTFEMSVDGANPRLMFTRPLARAGGSIYIDPFDPPSKNAEERIVDERIGIVLSGGIAIEDRKLELLLNQPSWGRSVMIAQAINGRFPTERESDAYAKAFNDQIVTIRVPEAYSRRPERFLELVSHVYVQVAPNGEPDIAQQMAKILARNPQYVEDVKLVWISLGKLALPIIQGYYDSNNRTMSLAALEAGIRLGDTTALGDPEHKNRIIGLSYSNDPKDRILASRLLLYKTDIFRAQTALKRLLDDPESDVRLAAYEALAENGDVLIQRQSVGSDIQNKFILDLVPSSRSMIYVTQKDFPRIVVFNPMLGFRENTIASVWNNRLMLRTLGSGQLATIFYQPPGAIEGQRLQIAPAVANLIYALGHRQSTSNTDLGFDMSYAQVINVIWEMHKKGFINAEFKYDLNPLAQSVRLIRKTNPFEPRPETEDVQEESSTQPSTQPATRPATQPRPRAVPSLDKPPTDPSSSTSQTGRKEADDGIMGNSPSTKKISPGQAWEQTDPSNSGNPRRSNDQRSE